MARTTAPTTDDRMRGILRKLHAEADGLRLYGGGRAPGVFRSSGAVQRELIDELAARGLMEIRREADGGEHARISDAGRRWLLEREEPRLLLEDLLRSLEKQEESLRGIREACEKLSERMERQRDDVAVILGTTSEPARRRHATRTIVERIINRTDSAGIPASLPELYRDLRGQSLALSIGEFHDVLRELVEAGALRLTPWTGALYQMPEPELALLIGHEVLYYVHLHARCAV